MNSYTRIAALATMLLCASSLAMSGCGTSKNSNTNNGGGTNTGANNSQNTGASSGAEQTITVHASNFKFDKKEIHVKKGDKVTLKLVNDAGVHGLAIPDFNVNIQENNGTATFTADKAGSHSYNCSIVCGSGHANMLGKLYVD